MQLQTGGNGVMGVKMKLSRLLATRVELGLVAFTIAMAFAGGLAAGLQSVQADRIATARTLAPIVVVQKPANAANRHF